MAESPAAAELGAGLGARATLVQFSSAFCAPCRATRRILGEVADMVDGVAYVEIDAQSNLGLVRRLNIVRTPTVLVLDAAGRIVRRATGQPRKADVIAALGAAVPPDAADGPRERATPPAGPRRAWRATRTARANGRSPADPEPSQAVDLREFEQRRLEGRDGCDTT